MIGIGRRSTTGREGIGKGIWGSWLGASGAGVNGPLVEALLAAISAETGGVDFLPCVVALSGIADDLGVTGADAWVRREAGVLGSGTEGIPWCNSCGTSTSWFVAAFEYDCGDAADCASGTSL